jgi:alkylated DNA repair protein alkB homolog 7
MRLRRELGMIYFDGGSSSSIAAVSWLPCHAIELHKDGVLDAHVDSVRFSGHLVAGLSLLSSSIMRLRPATNATMENDASSEATTTSPSPSGHVDLLLPPNSLYALTGSSRYHFTHELLPGSAVFPPTGDFVTRDHRLSIIFRDAKAVE